MECLSESLGHGDVGQVKIIRGGHAIAVCVADVPEVYGEVTGRTDSGHQRREEEGGGGPAEVATSPSRCCMDFSADLIDV